MMIELNSGQITNKKMTDQVFENLRTIMDTTNRNPFAYTLKGNWSLSEDKMVVIEGMSQIQMHPYTLCRFIGHHWGYERALDELKRYLHEMIDRRFQ